MGNWHQLSAHEVLAHFKSDPTRGLSKAEASRRLMEYGPNELRAAGRVSPWAILFEQFKNILIVILLFAVVLSAFLGHRLEAIVITVIVLFAVVLGFIQEYRAERAIEALKEMAAPTATVLRDGEELDLPARDLVPGDLIFIRAGDRIPADARLIEAVNLKIEEAAAMTLTDDNFASIVAAVEEGRGVFGNIKKFLMFLLSCNLGEIGLMLGAALLGLPLPLSAVQILYVNLATDGLPALALALDPPEEDLMRLKPRNPRTGIFTRPVVTLMMVGGFWSAVVNLVLFACSLNFGYSIEEAMTMTFTSLILIQFFSAYNYRSDRHSVLNRPFANKWLNLAILWELTLLILVIYSSFFQALFGTHSLKLMEWLIVIGLASTISPVLELAKWMVRRGWVGKLA